MTGEHVKWCNFTISLIHEIVKAQMEKKLTRQIKQKILMEKLLFFNIGGWWNLYIELICKQDNDMWLRDNLHTQYKFHGK